MKSIKFDGSVGVRQIIQFTDNGKHFVYAIYTDLNTAFNFGANNDSEAKAFSTFSETVKSSDLSKKITRVLIKRY